MSEEELLDRLYEEHAFAAFKANIVHVTEKWAHTPPVVCGAFPLLYTPLRKPYYLVCHNVAYATFAHMRQQTDDSLIYDFMGNDEARKSPYTLWYTSSRRAASRTTSSCST